MKPKVYILATCRNPDLLRATTLVFDTLRTGFPTADITVYVNNLKGAAQTAVMEQCKRLDCSVKVIKTIHHKWIEELLSPALSSSDEEREKMDEPFILCDTDMVFWDKVEDWSFEQPLAGRLIPQFFDSFTGCVTRPRLHTSLLFVDPARVRAAVSEWRQQFPVTVFNPPVNLFYPLYLPALFDGRQMNFFYDTCGFLYHAIGGEAFTEAQLDGYDHLHCGTISDIVAPRMPDARLREAHYAIFENPQLARGIWRKQEAYYKHFAA